MDAESIVNLEAALRRSSDVDDGDGVWPEHVETVQAFLSVTTQWRVVSIGGGGFAPSRAITIGLDYAGVRSGLDAGGIEVTPELWRGLQVMENAAVAVLNKAD